MIEGNVKRKLIGFAVPIFIGYFFQQLYSTVDSLIVGNLIGPQALAAVTSTSSFIYLMTAFFMGFSTGAGVVIARHIGAQDPERTSRAVHTSVAMGLFFSVVMTAAGLLISPAVLSWQDTPPDVYDQALMYLRVYFLGSGALVMYNVFVGILQASGDSRHPLQYLVISSLTNIVLDVIFIAGFRMDVDGAALATVLSEILSAALVMRRLLRSGDSIRVHVRLLRFDPESMRSIVRFGLPTALQGCVIDLSNMLIQSYINGFGSLAAAGIGASCKVEGFMFLPVTAFSMALTTFISQNMGAGRRDRVRQGMRFGLLCTVGVLGVLGVGMFLLAPQLIALFNPDPGIVLYGAERAQVCALFYCLVGFSHAASAVARGLGKPMAPMVVMLVCWCAVRVLVLATVGRMVHDIRLVFWIYPFTWTLSTVVYLFYLRKMNRTVLR